jgi:hypothetical protein
VDQARQGRSERGVPDRETLALCARIPEPASTRAIEDAASRSVHGSLVY